MKRSLLSQQYRVRGSRPAGTLKPKAPRQLTIVSAHSEDTHSLSGCREDWRTYRAKLVALEKLGVFGTGKPYSPKKIAFSSTRWAHPLQHPEPGCLLISKRDSMDFFRRAVVYVGQHDDRIGTSGYTLNKPSPLFINELALRCSCPDVVDVFGEQPLFVGGPVNPEVISILHTDAQVPDCKNTKISSIGSLATAAKMVAKGDKDPREFRLLAGYSGWGPYQLSYEVAMGFWYVVSASQDLMLPPPYNDKRSGDEMWRQILDLAGLGPSWQQAGDDTTCV